MFGAKRSLFRVDGAGHQVKLANIFPGKLGEEVESKPAVGWVISMEFPGSLNRW